MRIFFNLIETEHTEDKKYFWYFCFKKIKMVLKLEKYYKSVDKMCYQLIFLNTFGKMF